MKYILIMLLFINIAQANYIRLENSDCSSGVEVYSSKRFCLEDSQVPCVELPKGFRCEYFTAVNGRMQIDPVKKASFDQKENAKKAEEAAKKQERKEIKTEVDSISDPTIKKILKRIIKDKYGE